MLDKYVFTDNDFKDGTKFSEIYVKLWLNLFKLNKFFKFEELE